VVFSHRSRGNGSRAQEKPRIFRQLTNKEGIQDLPHIWGTDELKEKSPDDVLASEAISS
jgi:hypothetical protein